VLEGVVTAADVLLCVAKEFKDVVEVEELDVDEEEESINEEDLFEGQCTPPDLSDDDIPDEKLG
jgi:hypothetical protein